MMHQAAQTSMSLIIQSNSFSSLNITTTQKLNKTYILENDGFQIQFLRIFLTPRKINMELENATLEEENHKPYHHFPVLC